MTWPSLPLYWCLLLISLIPHRWLGTLILRMRAWVVRVRLLSCSITWVVLRSWSMGRRSWGCRLWGWVLGWVVVHSRIRGIWF